MDKLIRDTLHAKAGEVSVPSGAWERQAARLADQSRGPGRNRPQWRVAWKLGAVAAVALLFAVALAGGLGGGRTRHPGSGGVMPDTDPPGNGSQPGGADTPGAAGAPDASAAFHGLGKLAFVRDGRLFILDGETDTLREVEGSAPASRPAWSADGAWVAFTRGDGQGGGRLMVADVARATARELAGLPGPVSGFAWAPAGDAIAVGITAGPGPGAPVAQGEPRPGEIWLLDSPDDQQGRLLAKVDTGVGAMAWSPDGSRIAYVTSLLFADPLARSQALEAVPVAGGEPVRWFVADKSGIELVGWGPDGQELLFWVRNLHSSSIAADGLPLRSVSGPREPISLPTMLLYRDWLSWAPGGGELVLVRGGGRPVWDGKSLAVCDAGSGGCRELPQPDDAVSLDPAWSPDGSRIALVRAQRRPGEWGFAGEADLADWVDSRRLWLIGPDGTGAREIAAAGGGIHSPAWSGDGRRLLYIKAGAVWVMDLDQEQENLVADLGEQKDLFGFYGHTGRWSHSLAWHRGD